MSLRQQDIINKFNIERVPSYNSKIKRSRTASAQDLKYGWYEEKRAELRYAECISVNVKHTPFSKTEKTIKSITNNFILIAC